MKKASLIIAVVLIICVAAGSACAGNLLYSQATYSTNATGLASAVTNTTTGEAVISGPTLTLGAAGTYSLSSSVTTTLSGATFAAVQAVSCHIYRTNNTPASVSGSTSFSLLPVVTTLSVAGPNVVIPRANYTTTTSGDTLKIYCSLTLAPSAGEVDVTSIYMLGVRHR